MRAPSPGIRPPYVCARCGTHAVPVNLGMIAIVSLLFFAGAAVGLSLVSSALALGRDTAFFVDVFLSVAFFQLFAHRVLRWRCASHDAVGRATTDAGA